MPNGGDKNFVRLCAALDGFRGRYGRWPTRVVVHPVSLEDLREHVLGRAAYDSVTSKVALVAGDAGFRAEDDDGNSYDYGKEGFPDSRLHPSAEEWLGVHPRPDLGW
jgi:hypothetical protein